MDVVILAGGKCEPELAAFTGVEYRSDVPFQGRTMVEIVREAVSALGEPIIVGGPPGLGARQVEGGESFVASIRKGLEKVTTDTFFMATVDLPCLTQEAVSDFVERSDPGAALNYPIISVEDCDAQFPGMKRTTLKIRDGTFTGGNVGMMRTELMHRALPVLERAYAYRKSPAKLASVVGYGTLGRLVLAKLSPATLRLTRLEKAVGKFLGVPVRAIQTHFAEIGADIDNLAQYKSLIDLKKS